MKAEIEQKAVSSIKIVREDEHKEIFVFYWNHVVNPPCPIDETYTGGYTVCYGYEQGKDPIELHSAIAKCSPKDQYNKEIGRKVSLKKLLKKMGFSKEQRKVIWMAYFSREIK